MKKNHIGFAIFLIIFFIPNFLLAKADTQLIGLWRTYDLNKTARSIIKFYVVGNEARADVIKILVYVGDYCKKCKGEYKNKPYLGMTIISGLKQNGKTWENGKILDTDSGNQYQCKISLSADGKTMYFHAYKGIPLFGRTIKWTKEE